MLASLLNVVVEKLKDLWRELDDGDEIDQSHYTHTYIHHAPSRLQGDQSACHYCYSRYQTEDVDRRLAVGDKPYVGLAIEIVGDNRAVGKEEDGGGDEQASSLSHVGFKGILREDDAVASAVVEPGKEDDEGGAATDDDGVGEHAESL